MLPEFNDSIINSIDYFVVENIKVSIAFIKKTYPQKEINYDNFELLNEDDPVETSKHLSACIDGKNIGLLSDAGCPNIADPGSKLILHAHENNIKVIPLVGPSSIFLAMMGSGLNGNNFSFNGYLPIDENERSRKIKKLEIISLKNNQSQIFIETPYRNQKLLNEFLKYLNNNTYLCIAKNIGSNNEYIKTKKIHEWKKLKFTIDKEPTIFVFHSGEIIS